MATVKISVPQEKIRQFCQQYHIRKLAFFGSVLQEAFNPNSDIDILVEFELGHVPGFAFFALQNELAKMLGRSVDLHTPNFLSPYFREEVLANAQVQYARS